jgi:hypothetical protein
MASMAQNPQIARGPHKGSSAAGAFIQPLALAEIQEVGGPAPRGDVVVLSLWKALLPLGASPLVTKDPSALSDASPLLAGTPTRNFEGMRDTGWYPPDPVIAVGPNHVIQAVNSSFQITTKDGAALSTKSFASWWSAVVPGVSPFDPKVLYDQHDDRWVLLTLAVNTSNRESWYLVSTSQTSDPTEPWCSWALDADLDGSTPSNNWADFPGLGLDEEALYVTSNQFSFDQLFGLEIPQYSKLRVMGKAQFYDNSCSPITWSDFWDMRNPGGLPVFTLQPAHTFGTPGKEYLVNAWSPVLGTEVILWSVTNPVLAPTLSQEGALSVGFYSLPPDAEQLGASARIDTGTANLLNAVFRNGSLYTAQTVGCFLFGACARYLVIDVDGPSVSLNETYGAPGFYYFYPAIMPDPMGNIVTVFNRSSASEFVGIRYTARRTTDPSFQASSTLKAGEASYVKLDDISRNRFGDYNGIALDPVDTSRVWIYSEFADSPANKWSTWVGEVDATSGETPGPCPASTLLSGAPGRLTALKTLHRFRDEVMSQSPNGKRYIGLFYRHAGEASGLLLKNAYLRRKTRDLLMRVLPTLRAVTEGRPAALTPDDLDAIEGLMDAFSAKAPPQLRGTIGLVRSDLRSGRLLSRFRIGVRASRGERSL